MSYQPVPTSDGAYPYPPVPVGYSPPLALKPRHQRWSIPKYALVVVALTTLTHYAILGAFPSTRYSQHFRPDQRAAAAADAAFHAATHDAALALDQLDPAAGQPGTFFRDAYPIRSMLAFWELAQKQVRERKLDTCAGQLGAELIDAYHREHMDYCVPLGDAGATRISCAPVHRDAFSKWWPYPAAPCLSTNIRPVAGSERKYIAAGCRVTDDGSTLLDEMDRERFLGNDLDRVVDAPTPCTETLNRTTIVIGRQDQWNPFHVAEDLITTLVTVFIMARAAPELVDTRVQLVFAEGFGMDSNHFTPLWDRIGAWAPRRLGLDPWGDGVCLTNTIHSVGAGASLLSATGIASPYSCASTITFAAAHYYRHLFGLLPPSHRVRAINVLWLSRAKLDSYAQAHHDWSQWRDLRHITNEPDLIKRIKDGIQDLCAGDDFAHGCVYENAQDVPESWTRGATSPTPIRFASLDPTVHALETQVHYVGHATILVSSHGGALGLSLFLPPGDATIVELQVEGVRGNWHFQHMAAEMGHRYELIGIEKTVDVDEVWAAVQRWILKYQ